MSKRPWWSLRLFVPMLVALVLVIGVSCGGGATATPAPQPTAVPPAPTATPVPTAAPTATPVPARVEPSGTLRIAHPEQGVYNGHPGLTGHPQVGHVTMAAYEGLTGRDLNGDFFARVAKEWTIAPDNLTWTFKLKQGIQFHGGWGEMTAEDMVWSISEAGAEDSEHPSSNQIKAKLLNIKALDDYTIEVNTGIPTWDMLIFVTTPGVDGAWVVSKKQVEELTETIGLDAANSQLVGTGPWELVEQTTGEFWKFKAFRDHHTKVPFFDEMTFFEIPEESTRIANFQTGRVDTFLAALDTVPALAAMPNTKFMSQKDGSESALTLFGSYYATSDADDCPAAAVCPAPGWAPDAPYVSSNPDVNSPEWERARKVRQAMGLAIDRDKIVEELLGGEGSPLSIWGWATYAHRANPEWKWEYDLERAKQLLKEAGYEDGFELEIATAIRGTTSEVETCEAVADMWADIGITARIQSVPFGTMADDIIARTENKVVCFGTNPLLEPILLYELGYHPDTLFSAGIDHPFLTPLVEKAYDTFDTEERWRLQTEIGDWLWDNALDIGLYSANNIYPLGPNLDSWEDLLETGDTRRLSALEWAPHRK
jgi:ABC-type transport system substrate-binding protein